MKAFVRDGGTIPGNLTIRLSATMIDGAAPRSWPQTSTVHGASEPVRADQCPAPQQGNAVRRVPGVLVDASVARFRISYHVH